MALPDFLKYEVGTPQTWKASGGTYALTCTSVANNAARQGVKGDLGANRAPIWDVLFTSSVAVAATAGNEIELWWAPSDDPTAGNDNPGIVSGTDATYNTATDEYKQQLLFIGSLILSNNAGTAIQKQYLAFSPPQRYGSPVVVNKSGQALGGTAGDHTLAFIPREHAVEETA